MPPISFKTSINNQEAKKNSTSPNNDEQNIDESVILANKMSKFNINETIGGENSVLIAIRLPNGETIKGNFLKTDLIINIIKHASEVSNLDLNYQKINLLEMPRNIINDLYKTIEFYGLQNRTMLHIMYKTTS